MISIKDKEPLYTGVGPKLNRLKQNQSRRSVESLIKNDGGIGCKIIGHNTFRIANSGIPSGHLVYIVSLESIAARFTNRVFYIIDSRQVTAPFHDYFFIQLCNLHIWPGRRFCNLEERVISQLSETVVELHN